jgi:hypothetical protein
VVPTTTGTLTHQIVWRASKNVAQALYLEFKVET